MNKKSIIYIMFSVLLIFFILLFLYFYKYSSISFDHNEWVKSNNIDEYSTREKMARYLINKEILIGKSLDEIDQLLGQTSSNLDNNKVYYEISEKYGSDIDPVALEVINVYLDQERKAVKTELDTLKLN